MLAIRYDEDKWRAQFRAGEPPLTKVVLAQRTRECAGREQSQGGDALRQLVLDPAYQLK